MGTHTHAHTHAYAHTYALLFPHAGGQKGPAPMMRNLEQETKQDMRRGAQQGGRAPATYQSGPLMFVVCVHVERPWAARGRTSIGH